MNVEWGWTSHGCEVFFVYAKVCGSFLKDETTKEKDAVIVKLQAELAALKDNN